MKKETIVIVLRVVSVGMSLAGAIVGNKLQEKQIAEAVEKYILESKGKS